MQKKDDNEMESILDTLDDSNAFKLDVYLRPFRDLTDEKLIEYLKLDVYKEEEKNKGKRR